MANNRLTCEKLIDFKRVKVEDRSISEFLEEKEALTHLFYVKAFEARGTELQIYIMILEK